MKERILYPAEFKKQTCTRRREEVLLGIWAGKGTKEIAADLGVSPKTVEFHRYKLYGVFGVRDLVSLCRRAMAVGLLKADVCGGKETQKQTKATKRGNR